MEKPKSRVKEVSVTPLGLQRGLERFETEEMPSVATYRANLTGLSHDYNLYFVAQYEEIHVYEPAYPTQRLPAGGASLILKPPTVGNQRGYLNQRRPHGINHLIIDFLGQEEIILVCCDDGDVVAYRTRHVQHAIDSKPTTNFPGHQEAHDVRPFFRECVLRSAWGLSIHTKARKIAVSSNTQKVFIFSFALSGRDRNNSDEETYQTQTASSDIPATGLLSREENSTYVLPPTGHNIPCVSFCNTGDDPDGRFLATGDITGVTFIWDLNGPAILENYMAHFCLDRSCRHKGMRATGSREASSEYAVWGLHWLDPRSFRKVGPISVGNQQSVDISNRISSVPRSSSVFQTHRLNNDDDTDMEGSEQAQEEDAGSDSAGGSEDEMHFQVALQSSAAPLSVDERVRQFTMGPTSAQFVWTRWPNRLIKVLTAETAFPNAPFLQISAKQLFMHQPRYPANQPYPTFAMFDPLKQDIPSEMEWALSPSFFAHRDFNRMSFHAAIPELGVVVAASANGRCAVLNLLQGEGEMGKPVFFWRLEWLLPFEDQEVKGDRPGTFLAGLAVAPVQGTGGKRRDGKARRWRLMLYYMNHSILSYEISSGVRESVGSELELL